MTKLAVILGVPIALLATIASLGVVVVDVREGGPNGDRFVVPSDAIVHGVRLALDVQRGSWSAVAWWNPARRQGWTLTSWVRALRTGAP